MMGLSEFSRLVDQSTKIIEWRSYYSSHPCVWGTSKKTDQVMSMVLAYPTQDGIAGLDARATIAAFSGVVKEFGVGGVKPEMVRSLVMPTFPSNSEMFEQLRNLTSSVDTEYLFSNALARVEAELVKFTPILGRLLSTVYRVSSTQEKSLSISYSDDLKRVVLRYNPDFIVFSALVDYCMNARSYTSAGGSFKFLMQFMLAHEISHLLKEHLSQWDVLVENADVEVVNMAADAFINAELMMAFDSTTLASLPMKLSSGVQSAMTISGQIKGKAFDAYDMLSAVSSLLKKYTQSKTFTMYTERTYALVPSVPGTAVLKIVFPAHGLVPMFSGRSIDFINFVSDLARVIFDAPAKIQGVASRKETQAVDSKKGDDTQQVADTKQGSSSIEELIQTIYNSLTDEGKDEFLQSTLGMGSLPKSGSSEVKESLSRLVGAATADCAGSSPACEGLLRDIGVDTVVGYNVMTSSFWKRELHRIVKSCLSVDIFEDMELPSSRLEGEMGRESEKKSIKHIVLSIDCSGSMGPAQFMDVLIELQTMFKVLTQYRFKVHVVYWGARGELKVFEADSSNVFGSIVENAPSFGGTEFDPQMTYIRKKFKKPDVVVIFTDGAFISPRNSGEFEENVSYIRKISKRLLWVVPKSFNGFSSMEKWDLMVRRRTIKAS
jgi:hypothetical protein